MAIKTYGELIYDADRDRFVITRAEPHVCIKLKSVFAHIPETGIAPFYFRNTSEACADLHWFLQRYPMLVSVVSLNRINDGKWLYEQLLNELEAIHMPGYEPRPVQLKQGESARDYQLRARDTFVRVKRLLLGDDTGLGKSLTSILCMLEPGALPAAVVVQTHLPNQWKIAQLQRFTDLRVHIINGTRPYSLPPADVYIFKYSCLAGWVNVFTESYFKSVYFDEVQELRIETSQKYKAAMVLSKCAESCMGMSATPVYNFGDEIFNVLDVINTGCLGARSTFLREWGTPFSRHHKIKDPQALGSYLREKFLFLRRTRKEVGRELPPVNKIIHTVGYDEKEVQKSEDLARKLAVKVMNGSFTERGQAAYELDILARYTTGISKAREVAQYVRILLENDEPVVLAGWHRDVYDIWLKELADFKPVMYTGSETPKQKEEAKQKFVNGETKLFIISLRSGAGIDGLQHICKMVVFGELDYSPKVHDQLIDRVDRDGQQEQVTAIFLVSESGSDPVIINLLGLKASQAHGINNPLEAPAAQFSDESRIKMLAQQYLNKKDNLTLFN